MPGTNLDTNLPTSLEVLRTTMTAYATREVGLQATMPALVKRDISLDSMSETTDKIRISVSGKLEDRPETNGTYPENIQALSRRNVDLTFFSREVPFQLTNQDYRQLNINASIMPDAIIEASRATASTINRRLINSYRDVYTIAGTVTTSPFSSDGGILTEAFTKLLKAPTNDRVTVLNQHDAERAIDLYGTPTAKGDTTDTANLGTKKGFQTHIDPEMIAHVAGTGADILVAADAAKGATQVTIDSVTGGTLMYGDILTFDGHTQTYVVGKGVFATKQNADDAAQDVALDYISVADVTSAIVDISPPLQVAVANNVEVTLMPTHNVSLAFQKNAFIYAPRQVVNMGTPEFSRTLIDNVTNTPIKLTIVNGWNQQATVLSSYYGIGTLYPDFAVRMVGLPNV